MFSPVNQLYCWNVIFLNLRKHNFESILINNLTNLFFQLFIALKIGSAVCPNRRSKNKNVKIVCLIREDYLYFIRIIIPNRRDYFWFERNLPDCSGKFRISQKTFALIRRITNWHVCCRVLDFFGFLNLVRAILRTVAQNDPVLEICVRNS